MSYERGTCAECHQAVMLSGGFALDHKRRTTGIHCDGSGEPGIKRKAEAAPTVESAPQPKPTCALPSEPSLAADVLRVVQLVREPMLTEAKRKRAAAPIQQKIAETRARVADKPIEDLEAVDLDLETLARCGSPSLRAAIQEFLHRWHSRKGRENESR